MRSRTANARVHRARVAALSRYRDARDPELVEARVGLRKEAFFAAVERAVVIAPPMTSAIRDEVLALFPLDGDGA
jgi:hypothetical protein